MFSWKDGSNVMNMGAGAQQEALDFYVGTEGGKNWLQYLYYLMYVQYYAQWAGGGIDN